MHIVYSLCVYTVPVNSDWYVYMWTVHAQSICASYMCILLVHCALCTVHCACVLNLCTLSVNLHVDYMDVFYLYALFALSMYNVNVNVYCTCAL